MKNLVIGLILILSSQLSFSQTPYTAGTIGIDQTICYNTSPDTLRQLTTPTGGTGTYTYQWQRSTNGTSWSSISGATSTRYKPGNLTTSYFYRLRVISGTYGTIYTNSVLVSVNANLTAGTIGSAQYICYNTFPVPLSQLTAPVGGTGIYTFQWQSSTNNSTWTNIEGATGEGYSPPALTSQRYYRRAVTSESCGTRYTASVRIRVYSQLNPGTIGLAQTICYNAIPAALTQRTAASGGPGSYTYQWQNSVDNVNWTNIPGATSTGYAPPALTTNTYYRRAVTSGACETVYSASILITVRAEILPGEIAANQAICYNTIPTALTQTLAPSGGTGSYTYQWQNSADNVTWTNITGATSIGYAPPVLTSSMNYRRNVTSSTCGTVSSLPLTITVNGILNAGTIGTSQTICYNSAPSVLTQLTAPTGGSGEYTYQWQSSPNNSTWTNIAGATDAEYLPSALTSSVYFRRNVTSGTCGTASSPSILVTVGPIISQAQLSGTAIIDENTSTTISVAITGGTAPYTLNYTINGVPQTAVANYISGTAITTGNLVAGSYEYTLTSVTDAGGCLAQNLGTSITITAMVNGNLTSGTIGTNQSICFNSIPSALTQLTAPTGGTGIYSYQWQNSIDNTNWTDISGANMVGYSSPAITSDTYFRRAVTSGSYQTVYSNSILISVLPQVSLAQLSGNATIDENTSTNISVVVTGGTAPYTVNFTRNGEVQATITNYISGSNISTGNLAGGIYNYVLSSVTDANGCSAQNLGTGITVTAIVNGNLTAGTIGSAQSVCNNSVPSGLTQISAASGGTGSYTYQWQSSSDNINWTDIANANLENYSPNAITANTYFRRAVNSGSYQTVYTSSILISVLPQIVQAQLFDNITIGENSSTNFTIDINGGSSPFTLSYNRNGEPQPILTNYISGSSVNTGNLIAGTYEYALTSITDANGCSTQNLGTSIIVSVLVNGNLTAGSIGADQSVCYNSVPAALTQISAATGGTGVYAYQWQYSLDNIVWSDIANANLESYSPTAISVNTYFRRVVTSGSYQAVYSNSVLISVLPQISLAQLSGNATIDENTSTNISVALSGGVAPFTINYTRNGETQPVIANYTSGSNFSTGNLVAGTHNYVLSSVSDANGCAAQNLGTGITVNAIVNGNLTAGTIGSAQSVCYNTVPAGLTQISVATGGTGVYAYQWQSSLDNTIWTDILNANLEGYAPTAISANTYFRRVVTSGSYQAVYSNSVLISVLPQVSSAQLAGNSTINEFTSTNFSVAITGGTPPFNINYTRNGVVQTTVTNYASGSAVSTGNLAAGTYVYELTTVTDANGCTAQNLGTSITITATANGSNPNEIIHHYEFTYPNRESLLADGWDYIGKLVDTYLPRNTETTSGAIVSYNQQLHPGVIRIPADNGDLWGTNTNNSRNTLFKDLPSIWSSVRLKIRYFNPTQNYQQAGLLVYQNDENYVQVSRTYSYGNYVTFATEELGGAQTVASISESATTDMYFRLDRNPFTENITAYYSLNGTNWIEVGNFVHPLPRTPRLAIFVGSSPNGFPNADIEWAEIRTQNVDEIRVYPGELVFNAVQGIPYNETRSFFISTALGRSISWNQTADVPWITSVNPSGSTDDVLSVGVNTNGLAAGVHHGNLIIQSAQGVNSPVIIPVTLIVNPNIPVSATRWQGGREGAMSVSTDDGASSGYTSLLSNGFRGTFVCNGATPPSNYTQMYNNGMELGAHLTSHLCQYWTDNQLRSQEIEPNINGIANNTPMPYQSIITMVWPCGVTNYREQEVASDYFLAARGYNFNELEDATPQNFMNIKSFNDAADGTMPPSTFDFIGLVDSAISTGKWYNLVLHWVTNDFGAIAYANSRSENIWVAPIGSVVKYIMQRERTIISNYSVNGDVVTFNASRLSIPSTDRKNFEAAFGTNDITTIQIDVDDSRDIENLLVAGVITAYQTRVVNGNRLLFVDVRLEPGVAKTIELRYQNLSTPRIYLSSTSLSFTSFEGSNPASQLLLLTSNRPDILVWTALVNTTSPQWLSVNPASGNGNASISVNVNTAGLTPGTYTNSITVASPQAINSPQVVNVSLTVNQVIPPALSVSPSSINISSTLHGPGPGVQTVNITNSTSSDIINWNAVSNSSWLSVTPSIGVTPGTLSIGVDTTGLNVGTYNGIITLTSPQASNSPQLINVNFTINPAGSMRYNFSYADRASLLADGWNFIARTSSGGARNTEQTTGAVVSYDQQAHPGVLRIPTDVGDLWYTSNDTRNTLFRDLPSDWTSIRLLITSFNPTQNYQQAGLLVYETDDYYVQITRIYAYGNTMTFAREYLASASNLSSVTENATTNLYYRLDRDLATERITAFYSLNGTNWTPVGNGIVQGFSYPRLAIFVGTSPGGFPIADIAWAEIMSASGLKSADDGLTAQNSSLEKATDKLHQNYPNPFVNSTWIEFDIANEGRVAIDIYNSSGQKIETLQDGNMSSGNHKIQWQADHLPAGMYYLTLRTNNYTETIKLTLFND